MKNLITGIAILVVPFGIPIAAGVLVVRLVRRMVRK